MSIVAPDQATVCDLRRTPAAQNVTGLLAFAVGAELGGVVGALLAMPIAATYPTIERLWLRGPLGDDVVLEHAALKRRAS